MTTGSIPTITRIIGRVSRCFHNKAALVTAVFSRCRLTAGIRKGLHGLRTDNTVSI